MAHNPTLSPEEAKKANVKKIWKVAGILATVTAIEFALALNWPDGMGRGMLNVLFVLLTIIKAFYIVAEFMHLKGEVKTLIFAIILPLVFVIWFLTALYLEGGSHI